MFLDEQLVVSREDAAHLLVTADCQLCCTLFESGLKGLLLQ
jgi:hypothetical protein